MLQPGTTNSLVAVVTAAVDQLMDRMHAQEKAKAIADDENLEKAVLPPKRMILDRFLAATRLQMSQVQNRSAVLSAELDIEGVLSWFYAVAISSDKAATAKLWDGVTWSNLVMDKTGAFDVRQPWHVRELFKAMQRDSFGSRQGPEWCDIADIRAACAALPVASHTPADFVAGVLYLVLRRAIRKGEGTVYAPEPHNGPLDSTDRIFNIHVSCHRQTVQHA